MFLLILMDRAETDCCCSQLKQSVIKKSNLLTYRRYEKLYLGPLLAGFF